MNKFLPGILLVLITWNAEGQPSQFKQITKKQSGTSIPDLNFKPVSSQKPVRSFAAHRPALFKTLDYPYFAKSDRPKVIRSGNSPVFIEKKVTAAQSEAAISTEERFYRFLEETKEITRIPGPREQFRIRGIHTDHLGITHIRSIQLYKGVEIYGSESILHLDMEKERFTGSCKSLAEDLTVVPVIDATGCLRTVQNDLRQVTRYKELTTDEKKLLKYDAPQCTLVMYDKGNNDFVISWAVIIRPNFLEEWKYFVNALSGKIITRYNNTKSDGPTTGSGADLNNITRNINVYLEAGTYYMQNFSEDMYDPETGEGIIATFDANNTSTINLNYRNVTSANNTWNQKSAVSAHYNAAVTYEYFRSIFGRNSINGQGGNIISFVNVADEDGASMENAFWNGQAVFYGNGGTRFKSLAAALDVAAHELGHGVISNTANLEYIGQSGALNESFADIFGSMVDRDDWSLGEDVVVSSSFPSGALRDMADPHNGGIEADFYWQPAHVSEMYLGSNDNGGVHRNSGISNHAFYLFATAVGKDKAEQVYYRALTEYLTNTSQFIDLRIGVVQAAKDLYGNSSTEAVKADEAFDAVGIHADVIDDQPDDLDPNPGQEHLLIYNTDPNFTETLWVSPASGPNYIPLTSTEMKRKPSATDDGTAAVFVGSDSKIYLISLDPENPQEQPLSNEDFFDNVAVSKDGNRIAAISTQVDTAIYVYDADLGWKKFRLYNPTTSDDDINSGGVLYADAIEFDHTGEYLIYDAYNELNSSTSEDISYWDVGFIRVWDNSGNTFGDGSIIKLFTSLPENVNIGNPVFSKNSPNVIAFDYLYSVNNEYAIYGANIETGDLEQITDNTTLGFPSFSNNDDTLAFTASVATETGFQENINIIGLKADKITPSGSAVLLIEGAKWPVFYAIGNRELELAPVANFTADFKTGGAPLQVKFIDLSENSPTSWSWTFQGGTPSASGLQNPVVTYNSPGTYKVTLVATNNTGSNTLNRDGFIVVSDATSVDGSRAPVLVFYPNPVADKLYIDYADSFTLRIFNQAGKLLLTESNQRQIDVSELSPGLYIMEILTGSGTSRHKLMKH